MAKTRTKLIALAILVAGGGGAAAYVMSGDNPIANLAGSQNTISIEAAGVEYSGWPEMAVLVNGEQIALLNINNKIRSMYKVDVPSTVGAISTVEVKMTSEDTDCKAALHALPTGGSPACSDRTIAVRGLYLNDEKIEDAVAIGEKNQPWSLRSTEGGINWDVTASQLVPK